MKQSEPLVSPTPSIEMVPVDMLRESGSNARTVFDQAALDELTESIARHGVLNPLLVRQVNTHYELVAGARRLRAAVAAGLVAVPVRILEINQRDADDTAIVENLQRQDITPLEEARAFRALMNGSTGLDGTRAVAERIGKDPRYVWDRMRLLALTPAAQALLERRLMTVAHAIMLSRLTAEQQARAIDPVAGGLFTPDRALRLPSRDDEDFPRADDPDDPPDDPYAARKAVSIRELEAWVAAHVRFEPTLAATAAPLDFGPVAEQVATAAAQPGRGKKHIAITYDTYVQPEAKTEERVYTLRSWKRADGQEKSTPCDRAVLGVVTVGPGYGQAFQVCVHKECDVHWDEEKREREQRAKASSSGSSSREAEKWTRDEEKRSAEQAKVEAARAAFLVKRPAIIKAVAAAITSKKVTGLFDLAFSTTNTSDLEFARKHLGTPKTSDAVVRHLVFLSLVDDLTRWDAQTRFAPLVKRALRLDLTPILKAEQGSDAAPEMATKQADVTKAPSKTSRQTGATPKKAASKKAPAAKRRRA
jgi:ParB family chromosome partitioning protein